MNNCVIHRSTRWRQRARKTEANRYRKFLLKSCSDYFCIVSCACHKLRFSDKDLEESYVVHMKDVDAIRWITVLLYTYIRDEHLKKNVVLRKYIDVLNAWKWGQIWALNWDSASQFSCVHFNQRTHEQTNSKWTRAHQEPKKDCWMFIYL